MGGRAGYRIANSYKKPVITSKKGKKVPHLSCNLHKIGANIYTNWQSLLFCAKKFGPGWVDGWMDGWVVKLG
jgi:hypothetical protein